MLKKKYKAKVEGGKLIIRENDVFEMDLTRFEGKDIIITIGKEISQRSVQQNRYYWGVIIKMLCEYTGHSDNEMHELMKSNFLKEHLDIKVGDKIERYTIIKSTAAQNKAEWEEYMEKIRQFASEKFQLYIPLPNEVDYEF